MAAAIMVCLQLYIARFQHLQKSFVKITSKITYYSQKFSTPGYSFSKPALSSFYKWLPAFHLPFNITICLSDGDNLLLLLLLLLLPPLQHTPVEYEHSQGLPIHVLSNDDKRFLLSVGELQGSN